MKRIAELIKSMGLPFAYDHFAEGESPAPPFICWLTTLWLMIVLLLVLRWTVATLFLRDMDRQQITMRL